MLAELKGLVAYGPHSCRHLLNGRSARMENQRNSTVENSEPTQVGGGTRSVIICDARTVCSIKSPPFTLQNEARPEIRRLPCVLLGHINLRSAQCRGGFLPVGKHFFIELGHQRRGGGVVNFPETRDDASGACVHESARECHQTLA